MPNTNSARKSLRVGIRRNSENRRIKLNVRQTVKTLTAESLSEAFSVLDKAAKKNVIHPNKAARLKSRLSAKVAKEDSAETTKKAEKPAAKKATTKGSTKTKAKTKTTKTE